MNNENKNILFLHPNFPGQFKYLAKIAVKKGYHVKFLCQTHYGREIKGVEKICMKGGEVLYEVC